MAVTSFIPEVWHADLLLAFREWTVLGQPGVINRNYEGDVAQSGDTVHINTLGRPTVADYVPNVTVIDPETLATLDNTLLIDQNKYFAFEVDDVDARQAAGALLPDAASEAAQATSLVADTYLTTIMVAGAGTTLAAGAVTSGAAAFAVLRELKIPLDKNSVPLMNRWVTVSPEFYSLLLDSDRFLDASAYGNSRPVMNGEVGSALGFSVLLANTLPAGTAALAPAVSNYVIAGHGAGVTWADQLTKIEAYRPDDSFSDAIKGLHVYGADVVRPEALAVMDVDVTV